ncbi:translation initiation factor IF-2-like [Ornithorhynchus anatinus]|uniref:translation initiation factor IF-2-like n=1 Tax=Ornithorhynchus anatinus TaxID=9258 RepID=UPI0010A7C837|nr:translation initiation factor IF-2-like [Ornithorhynchus anatinus]
MGGRLCCGGGRCCPVPCVRGKGSAETRFRETPARPPPRPPKTTATDHTYEVVGEATGPRGPEPGPDEGLHYAEIRLGGGDRPDPDPDPDPDPKKPPRPAHAAQTEYAHIRCSPDPRTARTPRPVSSSAGTLV